MYDLWLASGLSENVLFEFKIDYAADDVPRGSVSLPLGLRACWILFISVGIWGGLFNSSLNKLVTEGAIWSPSITSGTPLTLKLWHLPLLLRSSRCLCMSLI